MRIDLTRTIVGKDAPVSARIVLEGVSAAQSPRPTPSRRFASVALRLYFSFVTLATVGYGDYTTASNLSVLEALIGQLYLVTVIAVLVKPHAFRAKSPGQALRRATACSSVTAIVS
jgi:hypothetical protein